MRRSIDENAHAVLVVVCAAQKKIVCLCRGVSKTGKRNWKSLKDPTHFTTKVSFVCQKIRQRNVSDFEKIRKLRNIEKPGFSILI